MRYEACLVELDEILKHLSLEDLNKIPSDIRDSIREKKDKNYYWSYDESKDLLEQNINRQTIAMLSYLNMNYLLNKEQRLVLEKLHRYNEQQLEIEKSKKYSSDNIFKKRIQQSDDVNNTVNSQENVKDIPVSVNKKEKWYNKLFKI